MENKKLIREELETIQELQQKQNALVKELGQIGLAKLNLESRQDNAKAFLTNLRQEEDAFLKGLQEKYGIGTIDTVKGEFIPDPNQPIAE